MKMSMRMVNDIRLINKRPDTCPYCGCEKIYKNGFYKVKAEKMHEALGLKSPGEIKVQMYSCANCGKYIRSDELDVDIVY